MTRKLKRIGVVKFGLVLGTFYGLISLIFIPFVLIAIVAGSIVPSQQTGMAQGISIGVGLVMCVLFPIIYAIVGGLFGMLGAVIYNLVASLVGGIEFEFE